MPPTNLPVPAFQMGSWPLSFLSLGILAEQKIEGTYSRLRLKSVKVLGWNPLGARERGCAFEKQKNMGSSLTQDITQPCGALMRVSASQLFWRCLKRSTGAPESNKTSRPPCSSQGQLSALVREISYFLTLGPLCRRIPRKTQAESSTSLAGWKLSFEISLIK